MIANVLDEVLLVLVKPIRGRIKGSEHHLQSNSNAGLSISLKFHLKRVPIKHYHKTVNMPIGDILFTREGHDYAINVLYNFDGRIARSGYWLSWLLWIIAGAVLFFVSLLLAWLPYLVVVVWLIFLLLYLNSAIAVGRKRLHDRDKSGWWLLLLYFGPALCHIAAQIWDLFVIDSTSFVLTAWAIVELGVLPGTVGPNRYGPDPQDPRYQPG